MSLVSNLGESRGDRDAIKQAIETLLVPVFSDDKKFVAAKKAAKDAGESNRGIRETTLRKLAERAIADNWSESDAHDMVDDIVARYKTKKGEDKDTKAKRASLATYKRDMKLVLKADLRSRVNAIFDAAHDAIAAEKAAVAELKEASREDKKLASPVMTAFGRAYHAAIQSFVAIKESANLRCDTIAEISAYAQAYIRDRKFDPERAMSQLSKIAADLADFSDEYQNAVLAQCAKFLRDNITEAVLKEGWEEAKKAREADVDAEQDEPDQDEPDQDEQDAALDDIMGESVETYAAPIAA